MQRYMSIAGLTLIVMKPHANAGNASSIPGLGGSFGGGQGNPL